MRSLSIGCAVLAAGASRRFGSAKLLAAVDGESLIHTAVAAAVASKCERVAVVLGAHAATIADAIGQFEVDHVENHGWKEGMASSVRAAVTWARGSGCHALLITVADQPRIDAAHLDRLIAASGGGWRLAASRYAKVLGVPALFPRASFDALNGLSGDIGARELLRDPSRAVAAVPVAGGAVDVDTPADIPRQL
jgi:CTP:molybdopterin cytidylyltransferase MocA